MTKLLWQSGRSVPAFELKQRLYGLNWTVAAGVLRACHWTTYCPIMYAVCVPDLVYHIAVNDRITLCKSVVLNAPDKRRRAEDWRTVEEVPRHRPCVLCSRCAVLAGDNRSFSERVTYPHVTLAE